MPMIIYKWKMGESQKRQMKRANLKKFQVSSKKSTIHIVSQKSTSSYSL